ncbi:MAG TPA: lipid II flippase MurJ, partial [Chthonomonadaceae bacterium]|nr:lipid II flippase MurJ [Chthonomonadaceae bacterium]
MATTTQPPPPAPPGDHDDPPGDRGGTHRHIAGATGIMMALILTSRVLGLVRDRVIAGRFGQGYETDIYNAAFTIPDLLFFLIAGGALSSAFIPVFTEHIATG